jgi:signal transduction histidine kinase
MRRRLRLTAVHAVVFIAATGVVLLASYLLLKAHLDRTLEPADAKAALNDLAREYVIALAGAALLALAVGWVVAGRILRPLEDSLEAQRRFVANASHELRSPLTVIRTETEVTLADPDATDADLRRMAEHVLEATDRTERLLDGLMVLARSQRGLARRENVDLATAARRAADEAAESARRAGVRVQLCAEPAPVCGDEPLLQRLAGNLVDNAIRYNMAGGSVEVTTERDGDHARLRVVNTGPRLSADDVARLGEPFERLGRLADARGAGLGLSIVRAVAEAHGGTVQLTARPDGGLDVTAALPARS